MSLTAKIDPIDRDVALLFDVELGPEARSKALADFAREQLSAAQETNRQALGMVPPHETFVDGRKGASVETVKPDGTIVFLFDLIEDALMWIGEHLPKESPVRTGKFAKSFILLADGVEVPMPGPIPPASEYVFANVQPYARKIERGLSAQAPDGVFQAIAVVAKGRFGNMAAIKFSYRALTGGMIMEYKSTARTTTRGKNGRFTSSGADRSYQKAERELRVPVIVVRVY
jgi:hypothetical protein